MSHPSRHRRTVHRRHRVAVAAAVALSVAAGAVAYVTLSGGGGCDGEPVTLTVAAAPDHAPVLAAVAKDVVARRSGVDGFCFGIVVHPQPPAAVAATLGGDTRPDVWAPDSSSWLLAAAARPAAAAALPAQPASMATTPVVLAMPRPMAEALGWPAADLGWPALLAAFAGGKTWAAHGHPEWGPLRLGMIDPTQSVAGQVGVLSALDPDSDADMSQAELMRSVAFAKLVTASAPDPQTLLAQYRQAVPTAPAAFPVTERELAAFTAAHPESTLVPVYPAEGLSYADYPYALLSGDWVTPAKTRASGELLAALQAQPGRDAYAAAGFRDPQRRALDTTVLAADRGYQAEPRPAPQPLTPQRLTQLMTMWQTLQKPNNVLLVLDTSGSMNAPVPGTGGSRLQMLQRAALEGIGLLNNQTTIGLWEFSARLTLTTDHRELVPLGPASDPVGQVTRREALAAAIGALKAAGGTGLYDTVLAGYQTLHGRWQAGATNLLVVITDGKNEDDLGMTLDQLLHQLRGTVRADQPLLVIGIAVGPEADAAALEAVTKVTGGRVFVARDDVSAIQQIVLAFAGRITDR